MNTATSSQAVDRAFQIASVYMDERENRAPKPMATPDQLRERFDIALSDYGRSATDVINDLAAAADAGLVGNTGPDFYGWVMGSSTQVGVAADILTSAWGQNAAIYQTAPAAAIAEEVAANWLLDVLDLPRSSSVGYTTGATMASYISLAAARSEILQQYGWDLEQEGMFGAPEVPVLVSCEAHASVLAVLRYLGFGGRNLISVPTDSQGRMQVSKLVELIRTQAKPSIVVAQAGHINSGAFDHVGTIADIVHKENSWLHVDGAFGLWARSSVTLKELTNGVEKADSWAVDGHKWLQVPYDSGYAIVKNSDAHRRAMSIDASYLNRHREDGRNPSEFGPELSRRARGFTTWATLQCLGRKGIAEMIERHCTCAQLIAKELSVLPEVDVLNDVCLNQVAVSFGGGFSAEENQILTDAVIQHLQDENITFVSGADWKGKRIMRISVIAARTNESNAIRLVEAITRAWDFVRLRVKTTGRKDQEICEWMHSAYLLEA